MPGHPCSSASDQRLTVSNPRVTTLQGTTASITSVKQEVVGWVNDGRRGAEVNEVPTEEWGNRDNNKKRSSCSQRFVGPKTCWDRWQESLASGTAERKERAVFGSLFSRPRVDYGTIGRE